MTWFYGVPMVVGALLALTQRLGGPRWLWASAVLTAVITTSLLLWRNGASHESSPVTWVMLGAGIPLVVATLLHWSADLRWPWPVKVIAASLAACSLALPIFMLSCFVAEIIPGVRGCFF